MEELVSLNEKLDLKIEKLKLFSNKNDPESKTFIIDEKLKVSKCVQIETCNEYDPNRYTTTKNVSPLLDKPSVVKDSEDLDLDENYLDYLTYETKAKLTSLKLKNEHLADIAKNADKKNKQMLTELSECKKQLKEANKDANIYRKQLQSVKDVLRKTEKDLKDSKEKHSIALKQINEMTKTMNSLEKSRKEEKSKLCSCQAQNNRLTKKLEESKMKNATLMGNKKEEKESMTAQLLQKNKSCIEIKQRTQALLAYIKKQDELIEVLQQQKLNVMAAKATKSLEEEFLKVIDTYQLSNNEPFNTSDK